MFRLYIRSNQQAGYRTLYKRTIKYNAIKLGGNDLAFKSTQNNTKYTVVHEYMYVARGLCKIA
jgi:hypothetical protein